MQGFDHFCQVKQSQVRFDSTSCQISSKENCTQEFLSQNFSLPLEASWNYGSFWLLQTDSNTPQRWKISFNLYMSVSSKTNILAIFINNGEKNRFAGLRLSLLFCSLRLRFQVVFTVLKQSRLTQNGTDLFSQPLHRESHAIESTNPFIS